MEWNYVWPLVGVVIGAMLTPYVTSRIETTKAKKALKPKLIKLIYYFYGIRKERMQLHNNEQFAISVLMIATNNIKDESYNQEAKEQFNTVHKNLSSDIELFKKELSMNSKNSIETESAIFANLIQFQVHFNEAIFNKLRELIQPVIRDSSKSPNLFPYRELTREEKLGLNIELQTAIRDKSIELDDECNKIVNRILSIV